MDQAFGAGNEVVKHILFVNSAAVFVPVLAKFAAAAQVGDGENASGLEPGMDTDVKKWRLAQPKTSVAGKNGRVPSIQLGALEPHDVQRNLGSIFRYCRFP